MMKRRHFLQFAGSTLATIGLSQFDLFHQGDRLRQALSQPAAQKRALLIGINNYEAAGIRSLRGCLTDVEMQKYLLMYRFGFPEENIITIWDNGDRKPSRANILAGFEELIEQTAADDVVLIHYSGHGSRVIDPNPIVVAACGDTNDSGLNGTIVPNDAIGVNQSDSEVVVSDIMGQTLFLLMSALKTDRVTLILDSCHSGAGTRGNSLVRAADSRAPGDLILLPSEEELTYQQQWLDKLGWTHTDLQLRRQAGIAKGVAIGSALCDQLAIDAKLEDNPELYAGGFTYLLTRYLWQQPTSYAAEQVYNSLLRSTRSFAAVNGNSTAQEPLFEFAPDRNHQQDPIYFSELPTPPCEAVITNREAVEFWLGGVSARNLPTTSATIFDLLDADGNAIAEIQQTSRSGFYAYGELVSGDASAVQVGSLLREKIIGIPANLMLTVGVDSSLGDELETAQSELSSISRMQVVEQAAAMDVLFGRFTELDQQQMAAIENLPPVNSLGLFTSDRQVLDRNTFGRVGEPAISAVNRLRPRFKRLLANKLLGVLMSGEGSSLPVSTEIAAVDGQGNSIQVATRGAVESDRAAQTPAPPRFPDGTALQVTVTNEDPQRDIYLSVLVIGSDGEINVLYPTAWDAPEADSLVERRDSRTVPRPEEGRFAVRGTSGFPEILILTSTEPLRAALAGLQTIARGRGVSRGPLDDIGEDASLDMLDSLFGDLTEISTRSSTVVNEDATGRSLNYDKSTLAVLSAIIEVIPAVLP